MTAGITARLSRWRPVAVVSVCLATLAGGAARAMQFVIADTNSISAAQVNMNATPMARGTGLILGRAIEANSSRPVGGAIVTLTLPGSAPLRVMADAQGQFAFRDLPAGRFSVTATRAGYVDGAYGRLRPSGQPQSIDLAADQHLGNLSITLWKYAALTGRVTDERGEPLVGANVRVLKRGMVAGKRQFVNGPSASTDDRGIYRISALEPGDYLVVIPMTQAASLDSMIRSLGLAIPPPPPPPGGGGAGNTTFAARINTGGGNEIVINGSDSGAPYAGTTDDGRPLTYQTEFYPSSTSSSRATPVTMSAGEERAGVDFQLKPVRAVNVRGKISVPAGQAGSISVSMVPADVEGLATPIETASATTDPDGGFRFTNIPPGQYTLRVLRVPRQMFPGETTVVTSGGAVMRTVTVNRSGGPGAAAPPLPTDPTLWGETSVAVGAADLDDVSVPLRNGLRVNGRVEFNGSAQQPAPDQLPTIGITLERADGQTEGLGGPVRGRVESTGQFATMGVPPGKYLLRVTAPRSWTLRGAMVNGQDASDQPIELRDGDISGVLISFTDRPSDLSGLVTNAAGQPDGTADVIVFPVDRNTWAGTGANPRRMKNLRTGKDGSYAAGALPAGDYFVAAVSDAVTADWQSAEFLSNLSRVATRVSIGEGEKKMQALTTARVQ